MEFELGKDAFRLNPEQQLAKAEAQNRQDVDSLEESAHRYKQQVHRLLATNDGVAVRDEVIRFADKVLSRTGSEQVDELKKLVNALNLRRHAVLETIPEEEREAFALALVRAHEASLH